MIKLTKNKRIAFGVIGVVLFWLGFYMWKFLQIPAGWLLSDICALSVYAVIHLPKWRTQRELLFVRIGCIFLAASLVAVGILYLLSYPTIGNIVCGCSTVLTILIWWIARFNSSPFE